MTTAKKSGTAKPSETIESAVKVGADAFTRSYDQVYTSAKEQVDKMNEFAFKNYDEIADFNKDTLEAVMASSDIVAKGVEGVGKELAAYAQQTAETNIELAKKLFTVKNIQEAIDLQTAWAKNAFDSFWAESAKLQNMSLKVGNEAAEPLAKRVNAAVEHVAKPIVP